MVCGTTIGRESGVKIPYDCPWDPNGYSYPTFPHGTFANILARGEIVTGYVESNFQYEDAVDNLEYNALTYPFNGNGNEVVPSGTFITWFEGIIGEISDAYLRDIDIKYLSYESSNDVLEALEDGEIDVFLGPVAHAAYYDGEPRFYSFDFACSDRAQDVNLYREPSDSSFSTYVQFNTFIAANPNTVTIGVLGTGTCSTYQQIYGNNAATRCTNDIDELTSWYDNEEVRVTNVLIEGGDRGSVAFGGTPDAIRLTGALFRSSAAVLSASFVVAVAFLAQLF